MKKLFKKKPSSINGEDSSLSSSLSSLHQPYTPPRGHSKSLRSLNIRDADNVSFNNNRNSLEESCSSLQAALKKNFTRRKDLEVLGRTVSAVHEALCSLNDAAAKSVDGADNETAGSKVEDDTHSSIAVTEVAFNPQGCVWNATLHDLLSDEKCPIVITCCSHDESADNSSSKDGEEASYSIELSPNDSSETQSVPRGMGVLQSKLQSVLDSVFVNSNIVPQVKVCINTKRKMNHGYIPKSITKKSTTDTSQTESRQEDPHDDKKEVQDTPTKDNTSVKKTILQIAQDISSDSSSNADEWDVKVQERRMARQSSKQGGAIIDNNNNNNTVSSSTNFTSDEATPPEKELQHARKEFVSSTSLLAIAHKESSTNYESTRTLVTADESSSDSSNDKATNSSSDSSKDKKLNYSKSTKKDSVTKKDVSAVDRSNRSADSSGNLSQENIDLASRGLLSAHSVKRLSTTLTNSQPEVDSDDSSSDESEDETEAVDKSSISMNDAMKHAQRGLMSKHSIKRLSIKSTESNESSKKSSSVKNMMKKMANKVVQHHNSAPDEKQIVYKEMRRRRTSDAEQRSASRGIISQKSLANLKASFNNGDPLPLDDSSGSDSPNTSEDVVIDAPSEIKSEPPLCHFLSDAERRSARKGIFSKKSMIVLKSEIDVDAVEDGGQYDTQQSNADDDDDSTSEEGGETGMRSSFKNRCLRGQLPMSSRSLLKQGKEADDLAKELLNDDDVSNLEDTDASRRTSGELRSAAKGIMSRSSMLEFEGEAEKPKKKANRRISFDDESMPGGWQLEKSRDFNESTKSFDSSTDKLVFSNNELSTNNEHKEEHKDILTEGQIYLGISMLVYMYSHLRETVRQGLTRVKMEDIDVHSCQSHYNKRSKMKYLTKTKTAGSIIRVVIDELDGEDENDADHELLSGEGKEYEQSQTAQFRKWIEDSKVSQLDQETENMIAELKRKVARHRWKRAISAVRLSYKLSGGKRPKFEAPVAAPGCENENRFVNLNQMMSEVVRKQPKYFKEGSIMDNLIESGIEVVWFSDLTQNDVVYGVCCQREEKKVTVVFRGTVNSHNWSMNLKFDTNEYRNPIKVNYPGREDELSLHSGFALYLMRKRKDTGISKMEEIFDKVDAIGREMAPDGSYKLCITGHSLGGALATLFGFYVAAKPRFSNLTRVNIWTYAAPRVGTRAFFHAYQYLERIGRIRHARFSNTHDIVPLIPFCNFELNDLQFYQHVGMRIQLHNTGRIGKMRLRNALDVTYPRRHDVLSRLRRVFMNNIFANLTTIKGFGMNHTPTEIQRRLLFASHFKKALASGEHFADNKRNKVKSLDEYYLIRARIKSSELPDAACDSPRDISSNARLHRQKLWILVLVAFLFLSWVNYIAVILNIGSIWCIFAYPFMPIMALFEVASSTAKNTASACASKLSHFIHFERSGERSVLFISKPSLSNTDTAGAVAEIAKLRATKLVERSLADARVGFASNDSSRLAVIDSSSIYLFNISLVVDGVELIRTEDSMNQSLTLPSVEDEIEDTDYEVRVEESHAASVQQKLIQAVESKALALTDKATGVTFDAKLGDSLHLVGVGVRKKSIINIYAVAMYAAPSVLLAVSQQDEGRIALRDAARSFDSSSQTTSFVLSMVYKADANTIASAIADSVKPRYSGSFDNVKQLESLISEGVQNKGGYATKGTILRFDCSAQGVSVSVDGIEQGYVSCASIGSSFVDVFTDEQAVSPKLIESCIDTWSSSGIETIAMQHQPEEAVEADSEIAQAATVHEKLAEEVEAMALPLADKATGVTFDPKLNAEQFLVGVGVRKKSIISIYAVAMYVYPSVLKAISGFTKRQPTEARVALRDAARSFDSSSQTTSFVLSMVYKADASTIAAAIADSVKPRYSGSFDNVKQLESLISEGVQSKGGYATKGTILRFDCSANGVSVSVDGNNQGHVGCESIGSAFVDVFTDDQAVSPKLIESAIETWSESGI